MGAYSGPRRERSSAEAGDFGHRGGVVNVGRGRAVGGATTRQSVLYSPRRRVWGPRRVLKYQGRDIGPVGLAFSQSSGVFSSPSRMRLQSLIIEQEDSEHSVTIVFSSSM